ncbi:MAG: LysR substrate-binding domain-containing protein [Burkholderiaceae bacterium]
MDLLVSFEAAARHLSFTLAAAERFVTQSAMSRQMRLLEDRLGVPLFRRRHRGLELTEAGRSLYVACSRALAELNDALDEIAAPSRPHVLSLTATPGFVALWLIPRLAAFRRQHPDIDVRLDASLEPRDLAADGFDIAVRYSDADSKIGTPLFGERMVPVCSPALLSDPKTPLRRPSDLVRHTLIELESAGAVGVCAEWQPWLQSAGVGGLKPRSVMTFSTYSEAVAAALAGQGIVLGRRPIIDAHLDSGVLVSPFQRSVISQRAYFLIIEQRAARHQSVQALAQWLVSESSGSP